MDRLNNKESPVFLLRLEAVSWFLLTLYLYHYFQGSWVQFLALFFVPDISLAGYLFGPKKGAFLYNALHSEIGPVLLAGCGLIFGLPALLAYALIWLCHIGFDRMLGIGLKYPDGFKHTHLGMISFGQRACEK